MDIRPEFVLKVTSVDKAEVVDYMALMLPTEGIEPTDLQRIKQFLKKFLQQQVNEALLLFTSADDHPKKATIYKANQARGIALKRLEGC